jgi:hypothetical protein
MKIWLITCYDEDMKCVVVSHGVNDETGRNVILPCMPLSYFKDAKCNPAAGMYYLEE